MGGIANNGGRALEQDVMEMLCQSDVFCWGLQGFNCFNCLAPCFSVRDETCMKWRDDQRYGAGV